MIKLTNMARLIKNDQGAAHCAPWIGRKRLGGAPGRGLAALSANKAEVGASSDAWRRPPQDAESEWRRMKRFWRQKRWCWWRSWAGTRELLGA